MQAINLTSVSFNSDDMPITLRMWFMKNIITLVGFDRFDCLLFHMWCLDSVLSAQMA